HNRGTPEYEALLAGRCTLGVPITDRTCLLPCSAAREYIIDGTFIRSEDAGYLFWATDDFYYPQHRVFDCTEPPAWATQAIYFSK
ncbi:hypothetical protein O6249_24020, partial [Salmonella enterica subsp. enterica]|uniref:hypothetical protein n=1 Tax=Salmonella enterica TaxID=28901 RepID=UPI0022B60FEE